MAYLLSSLSYAFSIVQKKIILPKPERNSSVSGALCLNSSVKEITGKNRPHQYLSINSNFSYAFVEKWELLLIGMWFL